MTKQPALDIFRVEQKGVLWMESATTLDDAKARIEQLAAHQHGDYVVVNHLTGDKFVFTAGLASAASVR